MGKPVPHAVVVDTSVKVAMLFASEPRHKEALQLFNLLTEAKAQLLQPASATFELLCAVRRKNAPTNPNKEGQYFESVPLKGTDIFINRAFLVEYMHPDLPYSGLKSGDLLIFAVAKKHGIPLITEDEKLLKVAKGVGLGYTVQEFLDTYES